MVKKKSKNPFVRALPYVVGFSFSAIFVTLIVTAFVTDYITNNITNKILNKFEQGCSVAFKELPVNLERCVQKSNEARTFEVLNKEICGGCAENQFCLKDLDLKYCEAGFEQNKNIINLRATLKSITSPFMFSALLNVLIIMLLFVVGFIFGWLILLIRR